MQYVGQDTDKIVVCVDSLHAGDELEGYWKKNANARLVAGGQALLACVRQSRRAVFVHVKEHSSDSAWWG
jgi:hypothetical protein